MSIQILSDSFKEHRTVDSMDVTTRYMMSMNDYYNGYGNLYNSDWTFMYEMYLPWEGDNYGLYYDTLYLNDCVLVDISMEPTEAVTNEFDGEGIDTSGFDEHKKVIVTYTWSNSGEADARRKNEASSWKFRYDTNLEYKNVDTFVYHTTDGEKSLKLKYEWSHVYLTALNPNIKMTITDAEGADEEKDYGAYNSADDAIKRKYIDTIKDTIPQLERREPHTTCTVTAYSSYVQGANLAEYVGSVNSLDFANRVYTQREEALITKNKMPSYDANDWLNKIDAGLWMFLDWSMNDLGNGFYEYELTFEYNVRGWNKYYEYIDEETEININTNQYQTIDFYNVIFNGMDYAIPNVRDGR
ncbi:MAG: hypothetical protein KAX49_15740 [Halanaerobiales bacterium]|nr:hypothetical protein [Halanaerobiales bacterium]